MTEQNQDKRIRRDRLLIAASLLLALLLVGSCFAVPYLLSSGSSSQKRVEAPAYIVADERMEELKRFLSENESYSDARDIILANYVDKLDGDDLLYAGARGIRRMAGEGADEEALLHRAITAMVDSLYDPHSAFMDEEKLAQLEIQLSGRLSGIGVAMNKVKNEIRILRVLPGTPAEEMGLQDGDIVREVDGMDVGGMGLNDVVSIIRGEEGTVVRLGIARPPSSDLTYFDIVRRQIEVPVVEAEMKEGGVGYLRLTDWTEESDLRISEALGDLRGKGAESLLVDLRSNPGGYMEPAIRAADIFLRGGVIVSSRGRTGGTTMEYKADGEVAWDLPVFILLDRGSASSSEIFAAALRENERCILVGETSFGKGSIQKIFRQSDGTALRLTIARYYTPQGRSIDDEGIVPDIIVTNPVIGDEDLQLEKALEAAGAGI